MASGNRVPGNALRVPRGDSSTERRSQNSRSCIGWWNASECTCLAVNVSIRSSTVSRTADVSATLRALYGTQMARKTCVVVCVVTLPPIHAHIRRSHSNSLAYMCEARKTHGTRINITYSCRSDLLGIASSLTVSGFDTVEVCGSNPHGPTTSFNELASRGPNC
jgi:hypothetical protein